MDDEIFVGIDLGTSNSVVSYCDNGRVKVLTFRHKKLIPSAILFENANKYLYGETALKKGIMYPKSACMHFKRNIGKQDKITYEFSNKNDKLEVPTYILDTNIFLDNCYILEEINEDEKIIIPRIVLEELSNLVDDENVGSRAEMAIAQIDENTARITFEESDVSRLPRDMFREENASNNNINDNKILSVALINDCKNTVLVTNDKALRLKVESLKAAGQVAFSTMNIKEFTFRTNISTDNSNNEISLSGKECAVIFLKYLRDQISQQTRKKVNKAIITVPAQFSTTQFTEIREAGLEAGFEDIEVKKEPVAAAVAYGLEMDSDKNILIYDFGGGTFDVSIIHQDGESFSVLAVDGDPKLGGEDFTQDIVENFYEHLEDTENISLFSEDEADIPHDDYMKNKMNIWAACEQLKCDLSDQNEASFTVEVILQDGQQKNIDYSITRDEFNRIISRRISDSKRILDNIISKTVDVRTNIDVVIMAGGTSSIPYIREFLEGYFGFAPYSDKDPATLIAEGAAIFADIKWNEETTITKRPKTYEKTLSDFGVGLKGHKYDCIIPAESDLPTRMSKIYSLIQDYQDKLNVRLFNRKSGSKATRSTDNSIEYIGSVEISHIPPMLASEADVEVVFEITKEYTLDVSVVVKDKSGNEINSGASKIRTVGV